MKTRILDRLDTPITELGFGAAGIGNLLGEVSNTDAEQAVDAAWQQGIRYFDSAPHYGAGLSERRLGLALHAHDRNSLLLSTKVGRVLQPQAPNEPLQEQGFVNAAPFQRIFDYSYDGVMRSFEHSLQRLGVTHIDLLMMHDIGRVTHGDEHEAHFRVAMDSGYRAMDELRRAGLIKAIGLGVNEWQVCNAAMDHADFDCFMVANCFTLLNNDITRTFTDRCHRHRVSLLAAAPFNSGILATGSAGMGAYFYATAPESVIRTVRALESVCADHGVPLPAAAQQFPLLYSCVKSVVIGMTRKDRIEQNLAWYRQPIRHEFWLDLQRQGLLPTLPDL